MKTFYIFSQTLRLYIKFLVQLIPSTKDLFRFFMKAFIIICHYSMVNKIGRCLYIFCVVYGLVGLIGPGETTLTQFWAVYYLSFVFPVGLMVFLVGKFDPLANLLYEKLGHEWVRVRVGNAVGALSKIPVLVGLGVAGAERLGVISYGAGYAAAGGSNQEHIGSIGVLEKENSETSKWGKSIRKKIEGSQMSSKDKEIALRNSFQGQQRQHEESNSASHDRSKVITGGASSKIVDAAKTGAKWYTIGELGKSVARALSPSIWASRNAGGGSSFVSSQSAPFSTESVCWWSIQSIHHNFDQMIQERETKWEKVMDFLRQK